MLAKRIIPCLDVQQGQVIKGVRFRNHRVVGDIEPLAKCYNEAGADELVFYDITASSDQRTVDVDWITRIAKIINIPFCVAGGIRTVTQARAILHAGADKISVNSPALEHPELINELVNAFGQQCVVVGIDSFYQQGEYHVYQYTGDIDKTTQSHRTTVEWVREVQQRGAGEIVLNCMNQDGVRQGYDIEQLRKIREITTIPLVASGGAGEASHFANVFQHADVSGALAASVFHDNLLSIADLKQYLASNLIEVRQ